MLLKYRTPNFCLFLELERQNFLRVWPESMAPSLKRKRQSSAFLSSTSTQPCAATAALLTVVRFLPGDCELLFELLVRTHCDFSAGATALVRACRQKGLKTAVTSSADGVKVPAQLRKAVPNLTWSGHLCTCMSGIKPTTR